MVYSGHLPDGGEGSTLAPGWAGVDTITLRELSVEHGQQRPVMLDHHLLMLVTVGHGTHDVDFRTHACRPGTLIWARPGQVIRYGGQSGLDAIIVCWAAEALADLDGQVSGPFPFGRTYWQLAGEDEDAVINEVSQLVVDCQRHRSGERAADLLRHQLAVLLLRLGLLPATDGHPVRAGAETALAVATYRRLRHEVERTYGDSRRVEEYAGRLGCSVRTLTRACLAVIGRSAKQVIDDRVTLQAMRLLAATDTPIADIGHALGFSEPTNFGRFFQREVGRSPGAFRAGQLAQNRLPEQRSPALAPAAYPPPAGPVR